MKKLTTAFGLAGLAAVLMLAGASCSQGPEDFCQSWVETTCKALTGCCPSGSQIDANACKLDLSRDCVGVTSPAKVASGELRFDSGAAGTCLGAISSCADLPTATANTYVRDQACANMLTGYGPVGSACSASTDCERAGDFATCYSGVFNSMDGVCAQVVLDSMSCSFSFTTGELHVCPDGMFCQLPAPLTSPTEPPSQRAFEFTGTCRPDITLGNNCSDGVGGVLPCATGLYCEQNGVDARCKAPTALGAPCQSFSACVPGAACMPDPQGGMMSCQASPEGATSYLACFTP